LIVLRAHTLTYPASRRVADHAQTAGAQLWLVVHQERPPTAVAQLLEAVPHEVAPLPALFALTPEFGDDDSSLDVPAGGGLGFPYLAAVHDVYEPVPRRRVRSTLARGFSRAEGSAVYETWEQAHDWTARWLDERDELLDQDAADAILALARRGDTASEIYVRIRAALDAFQQAGVTTNLRAVDAVFEHSYGETRPCELNTAAAHAAALADQTPDPELAALIAVAVLARSPTTSATPISAASPATAPSSSGLTAACSPSHPNSGASLPPGTTIANAKPTAEHFRSSSATATDASASRRSVAASPDSPRPPRCGKTRPTSGSARVQAPTAGACCCTSAPGTSGTSSSTTPQTLDRAGLAWSSCHFTCASPATSPAPDMSAPIENFPVPPAPTSPARSHNSNRRAPGGTGIKTI
jgi:hypothetical protein